MMADNLDDWTRAGFDVMPLRGKIPAFKGWRSATYGPDDLTGFNVGFRLTASQLVIDCDPRNYAPGVAPLTRLSDAIGFDLHSAPTVKTGGGGFHHFYTKPEGLAIVGRLTGFEGIDFKTEGGFVVAPGSVHPDTGRAYCVDKDRPPISAITMAPDGLLKLLARPARAVRKGGGGELSPEQLARLLACLDATDYGAGRYAQWIAIAAACHDATGGYGESQWLEWCESDPDYNYNEASERNEARWASFTGGRAGGATVGTLFRAVTLAGGGDVVRAIQAEIRGEAVTACDLEELNKLLEGYDHGAPDE